MKITKESEYYDDVHYGWHKVPNHWVGDDELSHNFTIWIPGVNYGRTRYSSNSDDGRNGTFDAGLAQFEDGY
jgi:hypothetical protein